MSYKPVVNSFLLKTSVINSIVYGANSWNFPGSNIKDINPFTITSIRQVKYRAEVVQVQTIGGDLYTPTASTAYTVLIGDPNRHSYGASQTPLKFSYVTPPVITTLGATAALQREAITVQLVASINAATNSIYATAATLTGGAGFTITDSGGYYGPNGPRPVGGPTILGANEVYAAKNSDGTGFIDANTRVVTTAAVYAFGVGATLLADKATLDPMFGNIISGTIIPGAGGQTIPSPLASDGTSAVSGQNYDAFEISSLVLCPVPTATTVQGYNYKSDTIFVDNGLGSATTNRAGFIIFEKAMHKAMFGLRKKATDTVQEYFDQNFVIQGPLGAVPVTTAATNNSLLVYNKFLTPYGMLEQRNIGTQTIVAPTQGASGLLIDQDLNTGDGAEYMPAPYTINSQQFVVGKTPAMLVVNYTETDVTGANFLCGFHEKNVFFADYNDYVNLGAVGVTNTAGMITTYGILANAATVTTASTTPIVNSTRSQFIVKVAVDGTVTAMVDNVSYPIYSAGTTTLKFAAGTVLIPFFIQTNITAKTAVGLIDEFVAVNTDRAIV